jgi:hypothetical protein
MERKGKLAAGKRKLESRRGEEGLQLRGARGHAGATALGRSGLEKTDCSGRRAAASLSRRVWPLVGLTWERPDYT